MSNKLEPVLYQYRMFGGTWMNCDKSKFEELSKDNAFEVRPLYVIPEGFELVKCEVKKS